MKKILGKKLSHIRKSVDSSSHSCHCGTACSAVKGNTAKMNLNMTGGPW